jgi:hypothetical protein
MRLGVSLPGPFWISTRIGGRGGCGCLSLFILPLELSIWLLVVAGIVLVLAVKAYTELAKYLWPKGWWGKAATVLIPVALIVIASVAGAASSGSPQMTSTASQQQVAGSIAASASPSAVIQPAATAAPTPAQTPAPVQSTTVPAVATGPGGCHPLSAENTCYEPGEYCPQADAGMTGVAGDGKQIVCEDNDGLRWEPVAAAPPPPAPAPSTVPTSSPSPSPAPTSSPGD